MRPRQYFIFVSEPIEPLRRTYNKIGMAYNKSQMLGKRQKTTDDDFQGKYKPHALLNVDSIPFELDNQARRSYVPHQTQSMCQISGPTDGSKRFGTIHMCCHGAPAHPQPNLAMFMKGQGSVYESEKASYHPLVDVYFQPKAWFDKSIGFEWTQRTLKDHVEKHLKDKPWLLFQDNLGDQKDSSS